MYLSILTSEEKRMFLGLAYDLATSDGDYSAEEQVAIQGYCHEMQMEFDKKTMVKPIDEIIRKFSQKSDLKTKKIIVFEAVGLAMADNNYDDNERAIILDMENKFGLDKSFGDECEKVIGEYISFQNRMNNLVIG
ncbi:hypothetical protein KQI77_11710 [Clostridium sp. MSJ-8]|uniref:hypothetical protein n=1 Tax=Clostridium sp. MSJ-8 TaxID=2841510 RepID=UPI001C0EDB27|nr:hypothetical protein [Clostridium sp. MSJ-8]MBU5488794.1 hypothetical protein [Clostridium sp. MSJ-8]